MQYLPCLPSRDILCRTFFSNICIYVIIFLIYVIKCNRKKKLNWFFSRDPIKRPFSCQEIRNKNIENAWYKIYSFWLMKISVFTSNSWCLSYSCGVLMYQRVKPELFDLTFWVTIDSTISKLKKNLSVGIRGKLNFDFERD